MTPGRTGLIKTSVMLSDGLTFDAGSVKVEIGGTDVTSALTVKTGGAGTAALKSLVLT